MSQLVLFLKQHFQLHLQLSSVETIKVEATLADVVTIEILAIDSEPVVLT
jgi:hypothetical protein